MMFYPVFAIGLGSPVLAGAIEATGYRASEATVYVDTEYCELISDRSGFAWSEMVGDRCVLREIEVLLYRIGDEVALSLPVIGSDEHVPVFLPSEHVSVQI